MKGTDAMSRPNRDTREGGQIIVIFALALVAMVAMVGLVLDGGAAFAQRRGEQNAADLAAMGAANHYLLTDDKAASQTTAESIAAQNGFSVAAAGTTVTTTWLANNTRVKVDVSAPHRNNFASVVGMPTWQVSTTATVEVGIPDTAVGAAPFIFNKKVFSDPGGLPLPQYSDPSAPFSFGDSNGDVPNSANDIAWTCYGTCGNVDSSTVRAMVNGTSPVSVTLDPTVDFNNYIGQQNNGNHTTLYDEVQTYLIGQDIAVPVVDDNGLFQGWATFHVTGVNKGSKHIQGYFVSPFDQSTALKVVGCTGSCPKPRYFGTYVLKLVD
jgi:Flp pilus assembly protein TadG